MINVNLALVLLDFVFRAGMPTPENLRQAYGQELQFPTIYGMSVLFHPGWDIDQLAQAGRFPHNKISYATVEQLQNAVMQLQQGYEIALLHTPSQKRPDHHTLSITQNGTMLQSLNEDAADALSSIFTPNTISNPYQGP